MYHITDSEIKSTEGKPYTPENAKKLIYGGRVNTKGIITKAYTSADYEYRRYFCARDRVR
jgi:hypothetical protein